MKWVKLSDRYPEGDTKKIVLRDSITGEVLSDYFINHGGSFSEYVTLRNHIPVTHVSKFRIEWLDENDN